MPGAKSSSERAQWESDMSKLSLSSRAVHADDGISAHQAVAPAMHVSTTFRYAEDPDQLTAWYEPNVSKDPPPPRRDGPRWTGQDGRRN